MTSRIQLHNLHFTPFLPAATIQARVEAIARELHTKMAGEIPVFVVMLKGAFVFATDLLRFYDDLAEVSFVRARSYSGISSTREIEWVLLPDAREIAGRHLIVVEDIVDSGNTMKEFLALLESYRPKSVQLAALLFKPDMLEYPVKIDYLGFEIPSKFVVGYGLDYDGLGRNLADIYQLAEEI